MASALSISFFGVFLGRLSENSCLAFLLHCHLRECNEGSPAIGVLSRDPSRSFRMTDYTAIKIVKDVLSEANDKPVKVLGQPVEGELRLSSHKVLFAAKIVFCFHICSIYLFFVLNNGRKISEQGDVTRSFIYRFDKTGVCLGKYETDNDIIDFCVKGNDMYCIAEPEGEEAVIMKYRLP